jgi:hypothetical protein
MALSLDESRVIDADTHLTRPQDLWTAQAAASMKELVPRVVADGDGVGQRVIGDKSLGRAGGGGVIGRDGSKINAQKGLFEWTIDDIHVAARNPKVRVTMMDEMGTHAEVLFPNDIGLGGQGIAAEVDGPSFRLDLLKMRKGHMAKLHEESG